MRRSVQAIFAGVIVLGVVAMILIGAVSRLPLPTSVPGALAMGLGLVATLLAVTFAAGYVTAASAPHSPRLHAAATGLVLFLITLVGRRDPLGLFLRALMIPAAWAGGVVRQRRVLKAGAQSVPAPDLTHPDRFMGGRAFHRLLRFNTAASQIVLIGIPAVLAWWMDRGRWTPAGRTAWYIGGLAAVIVAGLAACLIGGRRVNAAAFRELRRRLAPESYAGPGDTFFVELTPERFPRVYEGGVAWDYGFLMLTRDHLCFLGERTRFALAREQITTLSPGLTIPSWMTEKAVNVVWRDGTSQERTMWIAVWPVEPAMRWAAVGRRFQQRLSEWRDAPSSGARLPLAFAGFGAPNLPLAKGEPFAEKIPALRIVWAGLNAAVGSVLLAAILGVPFGSDANWWAGLVSFLAVAVRFAPMLWYHEPAAADRPIKT